MKALILGALVCLSLTAHAAAHTAHEAARVAQDQREFTLIGFTAIEDATREVRDVRRLRVVDPYNFGGLPGVELQRRADNGVFVQMQYRGWRSAPAAVDRALWDELAGMEIAAFAPPPPPAPPVGVGSCHAWSAVLAADASRTARWAAGCSRVSQPAAGDYVLKMIDAALSTRPDCPAASGQETAFHVFSRCFNSPTAYEDAALGVRVAQIKTVWDAADISPAWTRVRTTIGVPMTLGDARWITARDTALAYAKINEQRGLALHKLQMILLLGPTPSPSDRLKIQRLTDSWTQAVSATTADYAKVLQKLAEAAPHRVMSGLQETVP